MKKLILTLLVVFNFVIMQAQAPINEDETKIIYCQIVGHQKFLSTKVKVHVDYGQEKIIGFFGIEANFIKEENGKPKAFNSMIEALNYMSNNGWEFLQAYAMTMDNSMSKQNVYHWLMKKTVTIAEEKERERKIAEALANTVREIKNMGHWTQGTLGHKEYAVKKASPKANLKKYIACIDTLVDNGQLKPSDGVEEACKKCSEILSPKKK